MGVYKRYMQGTWVHIKGYMGAYKGHMGAY